MDPIPRRNLEQPTTTASAQGTVEINRPELESRVNPCYGRISL